ncbi:hypothetical protein [Paenibacillus dendrobii]|uniref:hypothetical protein n=1 Tax=Paenibacillus dendrobii TaxID=2691084 RepID=UPI001F37D0A1|nr:hypothetical protein [Paenibacillus dendrobii]
MTKIICNGPVLPIPGRKDMLHADSDEAARAPLQILNRSFEIKDVLSGLPKMVPTFWAYHCTFAAFFTTVNHLQTLAQICLLAFQLSKTSSSMSFV